MANQANITETNEWNENLMDCFKDCGLCCFGYFCLPCLFGQNAEKIDNSSCCGMCCVYVLAAHFSLCWIPHLMKRKRLREKYGLKENPECGDCLTTFCCGPCAMCQEARELKSRENQPSVAFKSGGAAPIVSQPNANPPNERV